MEIKIINEKIFDEFTGLAPKSSGGTETMYRTLMDKLPENLSNQFQIICSRVRKIDPNKFPILWLHDLCSDPEVGHLADPISRKKFEQLIFVSNWQFESYHHYLGVPYEKTIVLKNAIELFNPEKLIKPKDKINLIYHTTPHRGLEILLPVFKYLAEKHKDIHLDVFSSFEIYGWSERDQPYQHLFQFCKDHPQITYHGTQPNSVVREYLEKSHIFALPSIWKETSCIAAIEAMASKNLVVSSDLAALPETVGDFGYMYRYDENINTHAHRFMNVLDIAINRIRKNEIDNFIHNSYTRANILYNWNSRIKEWENLLNELLPKEPK